MATKPKSAPPLSRARDVRAAVCLVFWQCSRTKFRFSWAQNPRCDGHPAVGSGDRATMSDNGSPLLLLRLHPLTRNSVCATWSGLSAIVSCLSGKREKAMASHSPSSKDSDNIVSASQSSELQPFSSTKHAIPQPHLWGMITCVDVYILLF